jgi:hypothetical protein
MVCKQKAEIDAALRVIEVDLHDAAAMIGGIEKLR